MNTPITDKHYAKPKTRAGADLAARAVMNRANRQTCPNGHVKDEFGFCLQLKCNYSRYSTRRHQRADRKQP